MKPLIFLMWAASPSDADLMAAEAYDDAPRYELAACEAEAAALRSEARDAGSMAHFWCEAGE